jgi:hypothetical protein
MTIHKIQGATLQFAEMDIGRNIFEYGQTYVALSRIKSLSGLYLSEFFPHRIKANPSVIAFYESFPAVSPEKMQEYISSSNVTKRDSPTLSKTNVKRVEVQTPKTTELSFDAYAFVDTPPSVFAKSSIKVIKHT